jgi:hypothetical protein
MEVKPLP